MKNPECWVTFYENDHLKGKHKKFTGPCKVPDLNKVKWEGSDDIDMLRHINSLKSGSAAWLEVFDEKNYEGESRTFKPNSNNAGASGHVDLDQYDRGSNGNWQNDIESFILYDYPIDNTQPIENQFIKLYADNNINEKSSGDSFHYFTQNSKFKIKHPVMIQDHDKMNFTINLSHAKTGGSNDTAKVIFSMDTSGKIVDKIKVTYDFGSAREVPDWVVKIADLTIEEAEKALKLTVDCCEEIITEGLGTAAVPVTNKIIGYGADSLIFVVDHMNALFKAVFRLTEDGSTLYFSSVVAHSIQRLMTAYIKTCVTHGSIVLAEKTDPNAKLGLNTNTFVKALPGDNNDWSKKAGFENKQFVFWTDSNNYRVWFPDVSAGYIQTGMLCSVKIDSMLTTKDDHLSLNILFDPVGNIMGLQAAVFYHKAGGGDYVPPSSGLITWTVNDNGEKVLVQLRQDDNGNTASNLLVNHTLIVDAFIDCLEKSFVQTENVVNYDDGTRNLPEISRKVIEAFKEAVLLPS